MGLMLSLKEAVTVNVPELEAVGAIVYVYPDNVTKGG